MSRAIVHKTKGKLDLRSITTFGLNAKPNSDTPIGYFGTGLKYAIAVLSRNKIPVNIYIDGKLWVVEADPANFRGKPFTELYLCSTTIGGLIKKRIKLPFTDELGKNWELWQAFRELECNTRDEKGETYLKGTISTDRDEQSTQGYTCFVIHDERYVGEFLNKDKHFLKEGQTAQTTTERLQVFPQKSNHIYYRGVRIYDLKEPSVNTYNFLCQIDLTEDRTAKSLYQLEWEIEQFLGTTTKETSLIQRAVTAQEKTFERNFDYAYTSKGDLFLNTVESNGEDVTPSARSILRASRPPERPKDASIIWQKHLIDAIQRGDSDATWAIIDSHRDACISLLERDVRQSEQERIDVNRDVGLATADAAQVSDNRGEEADAGRIQDPRFSVLSKPTTEPADDDIPF